MTAMAMATGLTDEQRKKLSERVREVNKRSVSRPR
ncbi:Hypothetical protein SCLAV_p0241 (plasmid) [Streptomyces clavuligerus]|uniref:Uncharacterized protein n=1 Tax=Streptomyces clavuligerus TaxID=1901 RepID=B5GUM9_STRCL|nr:hypothetical protein SSCG_03279 [Streptomyces clavuligerus]EFG03732.1 Hypothetical protein SCLAV_p0241 [Streptomyces clavuligerus]